MTSHEYAEKLKLIADFLLQQPAFETDDREVKECLYFYERQKAISALTACPLPQLEIHTADSYVRYEQAIAPKCSLRISVAMAACIENYQPVEKRLAPEFANLGKAQEKVA